MTLRDHPLRAELVGELHARPPEVLYPPVRLSYLAFTAPAEAREAEWRHLSALLAGYGIASPGRMVNHVSYDLGSFRVKFERHGEFARYKVIVPGAGDELFARPAVDYLPPEWLGAIPGQLIAATHVELRPEPQFPRAHEELSAEVFDGNPLVGSDIAGGRALAVTDFRVRADGFGRLLVLDRGLTPRQAGRMVQRLLEMDTYRMMALLALPVARELTPFLARCESELAQITAELPDAGESAEPVLLDRLTRLEASMESRIARNNSRFSAADAYYDLVRRRIDELREVRVQGLQTFREFNDRRLSPAMSTCRAAAAGQDSLSRRIDRANQLLATRVEIDRALQNQALLASMDRRASLQLRLQQTVEGLSVAAFTYYVVGLVGYVAKGLKESGVLGVAPEVVMGLSIPVVALVAAMGIRRIRRAVGHADGEAS